MKKILAVILFVATIIATLTFAPTAAFAGGAVAVTEGDRSSLLRDSGYKLGDGYYVEISYDNYILYSSGIYQAFTVTFDKVFWDGYAADENGINYRNNILEAIKLLFGGRGYVTEIDKDNARFTAFIKYESLTDYYIANDIDGYEREESSGNEKKGFLFNEYESSTTTIFKIIETEGNLLNAILQICYQAGINRENVALSYVYGTPYKIITTDADEVNYSSGQKLYLHTYKMNMDNYDREIVMKQKSPNPTGWYVLAIIIGMAVLALPLTIVIVKRKKGGTDAKNQR